jgi:CubicO group peptidase (beta-lactamase class C family)
MPRPRTAAWAAAGLLLLLWIPASGAKEDPLKGLDEYIAKSLADWQVPGLALAVIKDDRVVLAKGYGVRKLGESTPVNEHTLFAIGSCSKAFTAATAGLLVDGGKMKWDDPVTKYLPAFQMYEPYVTRHLTVRDLLAHRSGLARHELAWYGAHLSRDQILYRMRYAKPSTSFRSAFGYQNIMYMAAGQCVASAAGKNWDDVVRERIFKPLGMKSTNTSVTALAKLDNVASPHEKVEDKVKAVPWRNIDNIGPAGSINSCAADMAQWLRLQLGKGKFQKERLLSSGTVEEMHTPQTVIRQGGVLNLYPDSHFRAYGLGWFLTDYHGKKVVEHGGAIDGMVALAILVPEEKLGVMVLTNRSDQLLPQTIKYYLIDRYLGGPPRDRSAEFLKMQKSADDIVQKARAKQEKERVKGTKPSLPLEKYAGTYKDDLYGELTVAKDKDKLVLRYGPSFVGELEHWHFDTFRATWQTQSLPKALVTFRLGAAGKVEEVKLAVPQTGDLVMKRSAGPADKTPTIALSKEALRKFLGKYVCEKPAVEIHIEMVGSQLKGVVAGLSTVPLVAIKPTRFKVEGVPQKIFFQFEMADGKVKGLTVEQEGVTYKLVPKK